MLSLSSSVTINPEQVEVVWQDEDKYFLRFTSGIERQISGIIYITLKKWNSTKTDMAY